MTLKASKGHIVAMKELASEVGKMAGRIMVPGRGERPIIGDEYCTVACVEGARFHTIQGVAKIGKGSEKISGDRFLTSDLPGGRKGVALTDGMGSGERAFRESTMVVEMLEELLNAGFPVKTAVQIMNTALVTGREEVMFSTIDVAIIDLYDASCEIVKAGAATTWRLSCYGDRRCIGHLADGETGQPHGRIHLSGGVPESGRNGTSHFEPGHGICRRSAS